MSDQVPRPVFNILNNIRKRELLYHVRLGLDKQPTLVLLNSESFIFNTNLNLATQKQLSTTDADCHSEILGDLSTLNGTMMFVRSRESAVRSVHYCQRFATTRLEQTRYCQC